MSDKDILKSLDLNNIQNSSLIANANQSGTILAIPLDNIKALAQVRTEFNKGFSEQNIDTKEENTAEDENVNDSINALALSIKNRGLQNPIIVRPAHVDDDFNNPEIDDQYVIVSGERRYRAVKLLRDWQLKKIEAGTFNDSEKKIETIDCIIKDYTSELDVFSDQLTENIQRVDLDGFETSMAIQRFSELYLKENKTPRSQHHLQSRIVMQGITGVNEKYRLKMSISKEGEYCANSVNYLMCGNYNLYFLGLLNSHLLNWYFAKLSTNSNVNGYEVDNIPVRIDEDNRKRIEEFVNKMLDNPNDYQSEDELNALVYDIYGLSAREREIVEQRYL